MDVRPRHIGIVGGMGPQASHAFMGHMLSIAQHTYGATVDSDYPRMSMESITLPGLSAHDFSQHEEAESLLIETVQQLAARGAEVIAIPCNTVQILHKKLQSAVSIPVLNIIEVTANAAAHAEVKKVYVLGTRATVQGDGYRTALAGYGIEIVYPSGVQQDRVEALIMRLEKGPDDAYAKGEYALLAEEARSVGADSIILGCTELSLLPPDQETDLVRIDSSYALAARMIAYAYAATPPPADSKTEEQTVRIELPLGEERLAEAHT